jgi:hypothetical protein
MNYLVGRQNPIHEVPSNKLNEMLAIHPEGQLIVKGIFPPSDELLLW